MKTDNIIAKVLQRMLPVGSIVEWSPINGDGTDLSTPEKVAAYYGFGKWESYGNGRFLLGVSGSHAIGSTGGEENHTLITNEIPDHKHKFATTAAGSTEFPQWAFKMQGTQQYQAFQSYGDYTLETGGGQPHNNMPPYITVYRWRRIK